MSIWILLPWSGITHCVVHLLLFILSSHFLFLLDLGKDLFLMLHEDILLYQDLLVFIFQRHQELILILKLLESVCSVLIIKDRLGYKYKLHLDSSRSRVGDQTWRLIMELHLPALG